MLKHTNSHVKTNVLEKYNPANTTTVVWLKWQNPTNSQEYLHICLHFREHKYPNPFSTFFFFFFWLLNINKQTTRVAGKFEIRKETQKPVWLDHQ